jgi:hypothetical protein
MYESDGSFAFSALTSVTNTELSRIRVPSVIVNRTFLVCTNQDARQISPDVHLALAC